MDTRIMHEWMLNCFISLFGAVLVHPISVVAQKKYLGGTVCELFYNNTQHCKPLIDHKIRLVYRQSNIDRITGDEGGFNFYEIPELGNRLDIDLSGGYELITIKAARDPNWRDGPNMATEILLSKPYRVKKEKYKYYNSTIKFLEWPIRDSIQRAKSNRALSLSLAEAKIDRYRTCLFDLEARVDIFATVHSQTNFSILPAAYLTVIEAFRNNQTDSIAYLLTDKLFDSNIPLYFSSLRAKAGLLIMKGHTVELSGNAKNAQLFFRDALQVDSQWYSVNNYANFLMANQQFEEARLYLHKQLSSNDDIISLVDYIYLLSQLTKTFNNYQDKQLDSSSMFSFRVEGFKSTIFKSPQPKVHDAYITAKKDIIDFYHRAAFSDSSKNAIKSYVRHSAQLVRYYKKILVNVTDTSLFMIPDLSQYIVQVATMYDSITQRRRTASSYFKKAIQEAQSELSRSYDQRYLDVLLVRYDQFIMSAISESRKMRYLRRELWRVHKMSFPDLYKPFIYSKLIRGIESYTGNHRIRTITMEKLSRHSL